MTIYFYSKNDPYFEFSNFSKYGVELDGNWWDTVEHYFQAQKFDDAEYREKIRQAHGPKEAARLGRSRDRKIRADWDEIRLDVMRRAVRKKFETNKEIRKKLLATNDDRIVENALGDYFWGCGQNGAGANWLGRILMEVRDELRQAT